MNKPLVRRIGNNIRFYRHKANLSQEELAERADVHRNYVSRVESGLIDISVSGLSKFAKGLRVSMYDLLGETNKQV
jgi:transcriptional regulator with XRE-family HTH domain